MPLLEIKDLSFGYPAGFQLPPTDLSIGAGDLTGFLGPNGAGKSTLLKLMAGLLPPTSGRVLWEGRPLGEISERERAKKIAYVPQSTHFTFPLTVGEIVEMGRHPHLGRWQALGREDRKVCEKVLDLCDLSGFKDRSYDQLSGGERQRVLLASALAQAPQLLLLDEPTLSLDLSHQIQFFGILRKLHDEGPLTVVVATHELNLAGRFLDRLLLMKGGKIAAQGPPDKVLTISNIRKVLDVEVDRLQHRKDFPYFVPRKAGRR